MTTPHKCPCCDGWGTRATTDGDAHHDAVNEVLLGQAMYQCAACKGAGVVWEPTPGAKLSGSVTAYFDDKDGAVRQAMRERNAAIEESGRAWFREHCAGYEPQPGNPAATMVGLAAQLGYTSDLDPVEMESLARHAEEIVE